MLLLPDARPLSSPPPAVYPQTLKMEPASGGHHPPPPLPFNLACIMFHIICEKRRDGFKMLEDGQSRCRRLLWLPLSSPFPPSSSLSA